MRASVILSLLVLALFAMAHASDYAKSAYIIGDAGSSGTRLYIFNMETDPPTKIGVCTSGKARLHANDPWTETVVDNAFVGDALSPKGSQAASKQAATDLATLLMTVCKSYLELGTLAPPLNDDQGPNPKRSRHAKAAALKAKVMKAFDLNEANYAAEVKKLLRTAPFFLGATAGARQIGANEPDTSGNAAVGSLDGDYFWGHLKAQLNAVRGADPKTGSTFTMEGRLEALLGYTGAAAAYPDEFADDRLSFVEMGGASVQICVPGRKARTSLLETEGVIRVEHDKLPAQLQDALALPDRALRLYCHSFLGNANNRMFAQVTAHQFHKAKTEGQLEGNVLHHPCLPAAFSIEKGSGPTVAQWRTEVTPGVSRSKPLINDLYSAKVAGEDPGLNAWLQGGGVIQGSARDAFSMHAGESGQCADLVDRVYRGDDEVGSKSSSYSDQFADIKKAVRKWVGGLSVWDKKPKVFLNIKGLKMCNKFPVPANAHRGSMAHARACLAHLASTNYAEQPHKHLKTDAYLYNERTMALNVLKLLELAGLDNAHFDFMYGDIGWEYGIAAWLKKGQSAKVVLHKILSSHWRKDATAFERRPWKIGARARSVREQLDRVLDA